MNFQNAVQESQAEQVREESRRCEVVDAFVLHKVGLPRTIGRARRGVQLLVCMLLLFPIIGLAALAIDMGRVQVIQGELQRSADAAAMAATAQLLHPDLLKPSPNATAGMSNARDKAIWFAAANRVDNQPPVVDRNNSNDATGDVVIGYLAEPKDQNSAMTFLNPVSYNSVRVRVQRTSQRNGSVAPYLATVLGCSSTEMKLSATATIQGRVRGFKVTAETGNAKLLPITVDVVEWAKVLNPTQDDNYRWTESTQTVSTGSDGIKELEILLEKTNPGNFGWLSIGSNDNGNDVLSRQVLQGVTASDLAFYGGQLELGASGVMLDCTPGKRSSVIADLATIIGQTRILPLYSTISGSGSNAQVVVVGFAGVRIMYVDHRLIVQPAHVIDDSAIIGAGADQTKFVYAPVQLSR